MDRSLSAGDKVANFQTQQPSRQDLAAAVMNAAALAQESGEKSQGFLMRDRFIGRHQRHVRWAVQDWLIIPNWSHLVAERIAGRVLA